MPSPAPPATPPAPEGEASDDPHVKTLSGSKYFFHGVGVYEYASIGNTRSQVYLCPYAHCDTAKLGKGSCLTFISAIAVESQNHLILLRGNSLLVDGKESKSKTELRVNSMRITAEGDKQRPERVDHNKLADCHTVGERDGGFLYHNCTQVRRQIESPDLMLDIGVVGPFEKGWLLENVSDRTFNIEVVSPAHAAQVKGLINGDRNGMFRLDSAQKYMPGTHIIPHPEAKEVTADTVDASDVLFPHSLIKELDSQCMYGLTNPPQIRLGLRLARTEKDD